jgi:hypothetical protein
MMLVAIVRVSLNQDKKHRWELGRLTSKHQYHLVRASMITETPWGIPTTVSQKLLANVHVLRAQYQPDQARRAYD